MADTDNPKESPITIPRISFLVEAYAKQQAKANS